MSVRLIPYGSNLTFLDRFLPSSSFQLASSVPTGHTSTFRFRTIDTINFTKSRAPSSPPPSSRNQQNWNPIVVLTFKLRSALTLRATPASPLPLKPFFKLNRFKLFFSPQATELPVDTYWNILSFRRCVAALPIQQGR
jgi:hypothetical protein